MSDNKTVHQTLEQERAAAAWAFASDAKFVIRDYRNLAKKLPAIINNNGLGQAAALLFSDEKRHHEAEALMLRHLTQWLTQSEKNASCRCYAPPYENPYMANNDHLLLDCITGNSSSSYVRATRDAMALLEYLGRFADGLSKEDTPRESAHGS